VPSFFSVLQFPSLHILVFSSEQFQIFIMQSVRQM
jgi:hypothetical protein